MPQILKFASIAKNRLHSPSFELLSLLLLITAGAITGAVAPRTSPFLGSLRSSLASSTSSASASADLIGGLIDHFTCSRTTNRGFNGRCVPRACCRAGLGVDHLCTDAQYTCCYGGGDRCTNNDGFIAGGEDLIRDRFPTSSGAEYRCERNLMRRVDWDAEPTRERTRRTASRLDTVIIHHTDDGERVCWSYEECRRYLRATQRQFQNRKNFPDIPWNFLINENGDVYEGMGWGVEGYHTESWNERSLGVAFIGDFNRMTPSGRALTALERLLECGVRSGYLDSYYGLYGHRDMRDTDCPGEALYDAIRSMKAFRQYGNRNLLGVGRAMNAAGDNSTSSAANNLSH